MFLKIQSFWDVTPYRLVTGFRRFGETYCFQDCFTLEDEGSMFLWNVWNPSPNDTLSHRRRPESWTYKCPIFNISHPGIEHRALNLWETSASVSKHGVLHVMLPVLASSVEVWTVRYRFGDQLYLELNKIKLAGVLIVLRKPVYWQMNRKLVFS